jgi:hypothetical protein
MLVTFAAAKATTSGKARAYASAYLRENGFADEGRWSRGLADWYVIGGRWSGALTRAVLDQEKLQRVDAEFERRFGWWIGGKGGVTEESRRAEYESLFRPEFPDFAGTLPTWRDSYAELGYEDDASIVTEALYGRVLAEFAGDHETEGFADFEFDTASPAFVGTKWLVVVDYHS